MKLNEGILVQLISLLVLVGLALFIDPREVSLTGKVIFFILLVSFVILMIVIDIYGKLNKSLNELKDLRGEIKIMDRISKVEGWKESISGFINLKKKGQLDPRIILIILIIVLIYLYIRSAS